MRSDLLMSAQWKHYHHLTTSDRKRKRKYSARGFYVTILVLSAVAALSIAADFLTPIFERNDSLRQRGLEDGPILPLSGLVRRDQECRLVHQAQDKCAFIKSNCPDEEAGLLSYLSLYYCHLPHLKAIKFIIFILWLGLLFSTIGIAASDFFCINLSTISNILGMSESMAGVTFLAFGNGSPDVFSTFAAMSTHSGSLAVGELIGAAGFITAVVAGSMALVRPFKVARKSFVRDVGFFVVAVGFSMGFLADGSLHLWECAVMVGFYVFYVVFVVAWHWWLGRRLRRRKREAAARGHFYVPSNDELQVEEEYNDEDDLAEGENQSLLRGNSVEDFGALERGDGPSPHIAALDEEDDEEARGKWLAELSSNMRVSRPSRGERRNTFTPIRPSLVGALEFRAVLSSLQRSRNIQTIPINLRRYSDDPSFTATLQDDQMSHTSAPDASSKQNVDDDRLEFRDDPEASAWSGPPDPGNGGARIRAVSANDATGLQLQPNSFDKTLPEIDLLGSTPPGQRAGLPSSPKLSVYPPPSNESMRTPRADGPARRVPSPDMLAPPEEGHPPASRAQQALQGQIPRRTDSADCSPKISPRRVPRLLIPQSPNLSEGSTPVSPFPSFTDSPYPMSSQSYSGPPSIHLPPPTLSTESSFYPDGQNDDRAKPIPWWPYSVLPSPQVLASTLFPTIYSWNEKNVWEKFLGIVAAPSVFLLAITLPVVESDGEDNRANDRPLDSGVNTPNTNWARSRRGSTIGMPAERSSPVPTASNSDVSNMAMHNQGAHGNHGLGVPNGKGVSSLAVPADERYYDSINLQPSQRNDAQQKSRAVHAPPPDSADPPLSPAREWNRWLVSIQTVTAPFFVVLVIWANSTPDPANPRSLVRPALYSFLFSLVCLATLMITTSPSKAPPWRFLLCFLGFIVSITWISTIANEVVGVLKAIGVILGISDAILGLTIFAVGNSLGDLVADITVARLGFPVMALSACFGGPMLNILLGVGLSGMWLMIRDGVHHHHRHPDKELKYKPYQIEVSRTLMISAVTLMITLVGLLVVVPWNKWRMDRRIGWGLVAIWAASTIGNVAVEVAGLGGSFS